MVGQKLAVMSIIEAIKPLLPNAAIFRKNNFMKSCFFFTHYSLDCVLSTHFKFYYFCILFLIKNI